MGISDEIDDAMIAIDEMTILEIKAAILEITILKFYLKLR